jgi:hypothetical protein
MESQNPKRMRTVTHDDIALMVATATSGANEGRSTEELAALIAQKMKEKLNEESVKSEDAEEEIDDRFADVPGQITGLQRRMDAMELRTKVNEKIMHEIATDLYKSTVRIMPKPRVKGAVFSEKARDLQKELYKDINILQVKPGFGYIDVVHRDFTAPKTKCDKIVQLIKRMKLENVLGTIPPYSPEGNILKAVTRSIFGTICSCIENVKDDMDAHLDKGYKPTTKQPTADAKLPKFSMANLAGVTFLSGEISRELMYVSIKIENKMSFKEVEIEAATVVEQMAARWVMPYRLTVEVKQRTTDGLLTAPTFKELRRDDRR